jgi:hypothetical protein
LDKETNAMKRWIVVMTSVLSLVALLAAGCAKAPTPTPTPTAMPTPTPTATGTVEVRITDKPPEGVTSFVISTDEVDIHKAGEDGWVEVFKEEESVDLLNVMGIEQVLGQGEVDAGSYAGLRMHVTDVKITLEGETEAIDAEVPSEWVKVVGTFNVEASGEGAEAQEPVTVLTLDFDAAKSVEITKVGAEVQRVLFKPTVKLMVREEPRAGVESLLLKVDEPEDESTVDTPEIEVIGTTAPDAEVSINGQPADVDAEGNFSTTITLQEGLNQIEVVASDYEGKKASRILTVTYTP